ncbi:16S rRNA (adenine(1518)-N(6)/adenine(1519)-N(6))-dimethyltransferase RsmA [Guyparkeria halophila]|uniref:Ribosomal RNA small subunit methyltransferase A n=1 Tax=Guyparkeria halophila TaxID=47960 RepID=A0ABZ0YZ31_9GAMM|nr:16S rRNA (adenine(1518)-N(6)/adenine(1519)-N(6))-dimethyltransferase RsmA [Guyparkeria halophila]WQH16794.1 16S rRNA (adenine(1518)-N(6)/adenine(1519)-N(6))-dimethyltransferase RsmA [Guyparkeria halophila]
MASSSNPAKGIQDGHRARKRFGQNFLVDYGVIDRILGATPGDGPVIEIGPGLGALTVPLAQRGNRVIAIELDRDVIRHLRIKLDAEGVGRQVELVPQDALRLDLAALAEAHGLTPPLTLVGNLPYNIATALITRLLAQRGQISEMVFMVQREVGNRLAAAPGDSTYGRLSVLTAMHAKVEHLFDVPPEAFNPPPKVDSSVIRLTPRSEPLVPPAEQAGFERLVTAAFAQRRKTLRNNLKPLMPASTIEASGIDPSLRAQALDIPAFLTLARRLDPSN